MSSLPFLFSLNSVVEYIIPRLQASFFGPPSFHCTLVHSLSLSPRWCHPAFSSFFQTSNTFCLFFTFKWRLCFLFLLSWPSLNFFLISLTSKYWSLSSWTFSLTTFIHQNHSSRAIAFNIIYVQWLPNIIPAQISPFGSEDIYRIAKLMSPPDCLKCTSNLT